MSALELYLAPNSEPSYASFLTTIAIIMFVAWTQMKNHLMYAGELDRYSIAFEKRMSALEGVAKELSATESEHKLLLKEHREDISLAAGELDRYSIAFEKRMSALEGVAKELSATESEHKVLLKEHGEDISLAAETAYRTEYRAASLPERGVAHNPFRSLAHATHEGSTVIYILDEPLQNFLRTSPKSTAREILSHLGAAVALKKQWWERPEFKGRPTLHDVNSRLYSLLGQGKLKKDDSARPVWSVV